MLQRRVNRQTGFIRKRQFNDLSFMDEFSSYSPMRNDTQQFSPFKNISPEPIEHILQTHRPQPSKKVAFDFSQQFKDIGKVSKINEKLHQRLKHDEKSYRKQKIKESHKQKKDISLCYEFEKQKDQLQPDSSSFFNKKTINYLNKTSSQVCNPFETEESAHEITIKPQKFSLTLAESFDIHCGRLKGKLQHERRKFSKSKNHQQIIEDEATIMLREEMKKRGKENIQKNQQPIQKRQRNLSIREEKKPQIDPKKASFFIPMSTTPRQRSITPKQAREHSFRKWKELPQVKAKEKQKEKQKHMRERIVKMRAHSQSVRRMMRK